MGEVKNVVEVMAEAGRLAEVMPMVTVGDLIEANDADALDLGVLLPDGRYSGLDIVRIDQIASAHRAVLRPAMQAALSALDAAGYAVVPKEPTEAMLEAVDRDPAYGGNFAAAIDYRTMLSASQVKL